MMRVGDTGFIRVRMSTLCQERTLLSSHNIDY
ncbi:Uncharacterised protein [Klebsiella pneumoniae]|uniref:Uncharacterized protein n=1 Tax=Klebsiella pneumoniae TaxID=573 RepID=A0A486S2G6_KLEPN|nr:hypothetical protein AI2851V1_3047 [Klebsiella pneumoniae]SXE89310.1 Uncharacterised protein [Klebsiella variicola]CAH5342757.1 hypothetical protein AI2851V1_3047 [Klebsiella pneumoniae]SLV12128.1 Uncharacterised protein [Klebsiella pneumoniae]SLV15119.1 Uncharacterised protein [Klebsiella pneumoniae]